MPSSPHPEYRFGAFRLLPAQRQLFEGGVPVKLGGRSFDMLLTLVEQHERAISKRELMDKVWPNRIVEENNLHVQVALLRKVLGAGAITTIPGRGYRFVLPLGAEPAAAEQVAGTATVPSRSPVSAHKSNLPEELGLLCGREQDVEAIRALLAQHRLVSIVGAGGIGKTRLAQTVAHGYRDTFPDGVWMVEFAGVTDRELVSAHLAGALAIPYGANKTPSDAIVAALAPQVALLVFDNCEHLLESVATIVEAIAQAAASIRVLVTSQEPLKTTEEHVYRLNTLAVPAAETSAADASTYGAIALFVARAEALDPRFRLTADNAAAVIEVCRRLDGIPLALELAAARLPLLGVEGLRARLDERFHVLTGGARYVLRRHQTLRAAFDFSHGLLSETERTVFRRAGVFVSSFAIDAAQAVCADAALDRWQVLDALGGLVDKSMVVAEGGRTPRLHLLETARAYALEKLADGGETAQLLERHAHAVASQIANTYHDYVHVAEAEWLARYEPELDNLRAALGWAFAHDSELAVALIGDSLKLWQELGLGPEALRHCEQAVAMLRPDTPPRAAGRLWYALAMLVANTWTARSTEAARRAVALLRDSEDNLVLVFALARLAGSRSTPTQEQRDALAELERLQQASWPPLLHAVVRYANAVVHRWEGRYAEARREFEESRALYLQGGAHIRAARCLLNVAGAAVLAGCADAALVASRQAADELAGAHDPFWHLEALAGIFTALLVKEDAAAAHDPFVRAVPLILRYDLGFHFGHRAALLASLEGHAEQAALLIGYGDAGKEARGHHVLEPLEITIRQRVIEYLRSQVPDWSRVERWMREGAALSDRDAYAHLIGASA